MSLKRGYIDIADNATSLADDLRDENTRINQLFKYESVEVRLFI